MKIRHPTRSVMCNKCRKHASTETAYTLPKDFVRVGDYRDNKHWCVDCLLSKPIEAQFANPKETGE